VSGKPALAMFTDEFVGRSYHHEAAVVFEVNQLKKFEQILQRKALEVFPSAAQNNWVDIHSSYMWHRKEEKGGWKTDWSKFNKESMIEFFDFASSIIGEFSERILIQPLRKKEVGGTFFQDDPRYWALIFLAQKLDGICRYQGTHGFMFIDEESDLKKTRSRELGLHSYITNGGHGPYSKPITRLVHPVRALNSTYSAGIQAADIVAYMYGRNLANQVSRKPDFDSVSKIFENFGRVEISNRWP
jgi:hypothetical protein